MKVRHLLIVGVVAGGALLGLAPSAQAKPGVCVWVDPYGVCVSNPLQNLPQLSSVGGLALP